MSSSLQPILASLSGVQAAIARQAASAHNVANLNTPGFVPIRVVQSENPAGGTQVSTMQLAPVLVDPQMILDLETGLSAGSGVDLGTEIVEQILALRSLQANILTLKTANEMARETVDLLLREAL